MNLNFRFIQVDFNLLDKNVYTYTNNKVDIVDNNIYLIKEYGW